MNNRFGLTDDQLARADRVYRESIVVDALTFMGTGLSDPEYLVELRDAGLTGVHVTFTDPTAGFRAACEQIGAWLTHIEARSDVALLAEHAGDLERAKREHKVAIIAGMQNGKPIEDALGLVRVFHRLGIRIVIPAYHYANYLGSGGGERGDYGMSRFGLNVVREMNRLGMLVDVSHCSPATVWDAIRHSVAPVAITHANPERFGDHRRNKSDEMIKAVAEKGGVIGLTAWSEHLESALRRRPTIEDFLDMIDHVVKLAGEDHVGFGLDLTPQWAREGPTGYDAFGRIYPGMFQSTYEERNFEGLTDCHCIIDISRGLVARGYSDEAIRKINGGNWLRLFRRVWDNPSREADYPEAVHIKGGA